MERYQKLTWMGFPEDDNTLIVAQKYNTIEECVGYLTKDECIEKDEAETTSYTYLGIQSIVGSVFNMIYNTETKDNQHPLDIKGGILCKCGSKMVLKDSVKCYENTNYLFVICDECEIKCEDDSKVYHCPKFQIDQHPEGYDICTQCALKRIDIESNEPESDGIVMNIAEAVPPKLVKRALIIQSVSNEGAYGCEDAVALSKVFEQLNYQVIHYMLYVL